MNTAVTIPWEAVVEGCPPSLQANGQAVGAPRLLPLRMSRCCWSRAGHSPERDPRRLFREIAFLLPDAMAMVCKSKSTDTVELPLPAWGMAAFLTSNGESAVVVQALHFATASPDWPDYPTCRDSVARTYVMRYARFDADARAFTTPPGADDRAERSPQMSFANPRAWGFGQGPDGRTWSAAGFTSSPATTSRPPKHGDLTRPPIEDPLAQPTPDRGDPFQCALQLRQLRAMCARPRPDSPEDWRYHLAVSLGRCRLFGVPLEPADDFSLAPKAFEPAATQLLEHLGYVYRNYRHGFDRYGAHVMRNIALDLLEARMDAHAAYLALDEAYAAALYDASPEAPAMSRRLTQVRRLINLFDGNLQKNLPLLRLAASTYLLDNWRRLLAPTYRDCPPWWLDGCIG